jgi:AraC-like DNA-binding protein
MRRQVDDDVVAGESAAHFGLIEEIDLYRPDAMSGQARTADRRANHSRDVASRRVKESHDAAADDTSRACEKNLHVISILGPVFIIFQERLSDSPFVERVWRCHSERAGTFLSIAANHFEMAVTRHRGRTFLTLRGPETKATPVDCPAEGEWLGIRFKLGTFMPHFPPGTLIDQRDVTLGAATRGSFWLNGSAWDYPEFENADTFVQQLVRAGLIVRDPDVEAVVRGARPELSLRSAQRHFLRATGLTHSAARQIERARHATNLLREGASILDTVHAAGYFDQAHLTRSLKYRIGQTPAEIMRAREQLSFLYKTAPLP